MDSSKTPPVKKKFEQEYIINSSLQILFDYITSPSSLSEWFADNVNSKDKIYTFVWGDTQEKARLVAISSDGWVRFQWEADAGTEYFFQFRILLDEITRDTSLMVTDFAPEDEFEEAELYWQNKIADLKHALGSV